MFKFHPSESTMRRDEKKAICAKLIKKIKEVCDDHDSRLTFIFFPSPRHMIHQGWYEVWLREVFHDLSIDYFDLTPALREYVKANGLRWYKDLYKFHCHPDEQENMMIARMISDYLIERYDY